MENRESSPHGGLQRDRRSSLPTDNSTISDEEKARPPAEPQTGTQPSDGGIVPRENDGGEKAEQSPAPDGGLAAWLVAVGASCSFFCCLGFANSFGTFAEYYLTHQLRGRSPDDVSWIGSLSSFLQFFSGAVGGPLFDRFGAKVIRPAGLLYIAAVMILSVCTQYWHFMLVQGVLMGLVMGLLQLPAVAAVSQYFDRRRGAALGIAISGSSIGGIVLPIAISHMLNASSLGYGWTVRIVGFVLLPFMMLVVLAVRPRLPPRRSRFWLPEAFRDNRLRLLVLSSFFVFMGSFLPLFYLPTYGVARAHLTADFAGSLLAIVNGASTLGRIVPGVLADRNGRLNTYAVGCLATAVLVFCFDLPRSKGAVVAYSVVFGLTSGTVISGVATAFSGLPADARDVGTYAGMGMAIGALGTLIGPPIAGALVKHYAGYFELAMFGGATCLAGGVVAVLTKLATPEGLWGRV